MRAVQYSEFGGPEVLQIAEVEEPHAGPDQIRVVVRAVGVNPIDWKVSSGAMGGQLPGRIGSEVSGVVDEVGDNVTNVTAGDEVFGPATGGAADFALLSNWAHIPATLDFAGAAALPVAVETAVRGLEELGVGSGMTLLINGASGGVGTAAVQLAIARGATVIATASESNHERLRGYGAQVTTYGDGLAERVAALAAGPVDRALDLALSGALPALVAIVGDDPDHVVAIADFAGAQEAGVRFSGGPGTTRHWEALDHVAALADQGTFVLPVQQTFLLDQVADAERLSQAGHLRGKLVLLVD
jgi:NADPH:quinone reductase-like Zn-dependent oxidoreductase